MGAGLATIGAALAWLARGPEGVERVIQGAVKATPWSAHRTGVTTPIAEAAEPGFEELLAENSNESWAKIAARYPGAKPDTKRAVLHRLADCKDLRVALGRLLATVGDDPLPASEDPMVTDSGELLKTRWKNAEQFDFGRRVMVMQKTDKRRWVVANALITAAKKIRDDGPLGPQKRRLQAKLVDLHSRSQSGFVRGAIVEGMQALGGTDAALILESGGQVTDEDLTTVRDRQRAVRQVLHDAP